MLDHQGLQATTEGKQNYQNKRIDHSADDIVEKKRGEKKWRIGKKDEKEVEGKRKQMIIRRTKTRG